MYFKKILSYFVLSLLFHSIIFATTYVSSCTEEVKRALREGNVVQAEELCRKCLSKNSTSAENWSVLGDIFATKGLLDSAIYAYQTSLHFADTSLRTRTNLALCYLQTGNFTECIQNCNILLQRDSALSDVWNIRGYAHTLTGMNNEAVFDFSQAITHTSSPEAHLYRSRAVAAAANAQWKMSLQDYTQCLHLSAALSSTASDDAKLTRMECYLGAGDALRQLQQFAPAQKYYDSAIALGADSYRKPMKNKRLYSVRVYRGHTFLERGILDSADRDYARAREFDSTNIEASYGIAVVAYQRNSFAHALSLFSSIISQNGEFYEAYIMRGNCFAQLGQNENALLDWNYYLEHTPETEENHERRLEIQTKIVELSAR